MGTLLCVGFVLILVMGYVPQILFTQQRGAAHKARERASLVVMAIMATIAIAAIAGFFAIVGKSVWAFFKVVPIGEFLLKSDWNISQALMSDEFNGAFGALGLFWGTLYIAIIAMGVAWMIGYPAAIYVALRSARVLNLIKSFCQILVAVPSVVWGLIAVLLIATFIRTVFPAASANNALTAGIAMGLMLCPWVLLLVLEGIRQVPKSQWEGGKALGLDERKLFALIIRPQTKAHVWAGLVATGSKAITETMVVLLAAGLRPQISLNPLDEMTTVTVQIASLMTGDVPFDHPVVMASFALLSFLVAFSAIANMWLVYHYRKGSRGQRSAGYLGARMPQGVDTVRRISWSWRNRLACLIVCVTPVFLVCVIGYKAIPALFVTELKLACADSRPMPAREALRKHLGLSETLSRSDTRALLHTLPDPDQEVRCGQRLRVDYRLDQWHKSNHAWMGARAVETPRWAPELERALSLRLRLSVLTSGDSSEPGLAGMGQAAWGTIFSMIVIGIVVVPMAIAAAVFLHFYLHTWGEWGRHAANTIEGAGNTLLSFPVITFGIIGHAVLIRAMSLPRGSGWVVALTLGLIAFPYVVLTTMAAIKAVPDKKEQLDAGQALGLTRFETIWKIVVPQAAPAIIAGAIFGIVHSVGETAALLPVGANAFIGNVDVNPMSPTTSLSVQIYLWITNARAGFDSLAALAAFVLLSLCLSLALVGIAISHRKGFGEKPPKIHRPWRLVIRARTR